MLPPDAYPRHAGPTAGHEGSTDAGPTSVAGRKAAEGTLWSAQADTSVRGLKVRAPLDAGWVGLINPALGRPHAGWVDGANPACVFTNRGRGFALRSSGMLVRVARRRPSRSEERRVGKVWLSRCRSRW